MTLAARHAALWDEMCDDLLCVIANKLAPPALNARALQPRHLVEAADEVLAELVDQSVGAAHYMRLNRTARDRVDRIRWQHALAHNRRCHSLTAACIQVLAARKMDTDDWPLLVLRLRGRLAAADGATHKLSHTTPIAKHALRAAYCAVAKDVHPDRSPPAVGSLATQAMTTLNEAYRQAVLHFSERATPEIILLDALGLEHHA